MVVMKLRKRSEKGEKDPNSLVHKLCAIKVRIKKDAYVNAFKTVFKHRMILSIYAFYVPSQHGHITCVSRGAGAESLF